MAIRAQYRAGVVGGAAVPGYVEEEGVPPDSRTETYTALRLHVSNWRWAGVPFDTTSPIPQYRSGSAGPVEAEALLDGGRRWRRL
jgi:glucose-6-phosphate 1-dehydrogenase